MIYADLVLARHRVDSDPNHGVRATGCLVEFGRADRPLTLEQSSKLEDVLIILHQVLFTSHELIGVRVQPYWTFGRQIDRQHSIGLAHGNRHHCFASFLLQPLQNSQGSPREEAKIVVKVVQIVRRCLLEDAKFANHRMRLPTTSLAIS